MAISYVTTATDIDAISSGSKIQDALIRDALTGVKTALTDLNSRVVTTVATFTGTTGTAGSINTDINTLRVALINAGILV